MSIRTDIFDSLVRVETDEEAAELSSLVVPEAVLANRYELGGRLGEGGMAVVRLARDRSLGRDVALKSIPVEALTPQRLGRFVAEARITAQLQHPGIIPIHDFFVSSEGEVFYSMKQIHGRSLRDALDELLRGQEDALATYGLSHLMQIFLRICQAVGYAHSRGVVHRDLKPDNVMLGDHGEVLVMDWGLAKALGEASFTGKFPVLTERRVTDTTDDAMVGSPAYMAPETLPGRDQDAHFRTDVYALGVTLYELLCWHRPFEAETLPRLLYLVAKGEFLAPKKRAPEREIPDELEAICLRALNADPQSRFSDGVQLAEAVSQWLSGVRPRREAARLCREGRSLLGSYQRQAAEVAQAELQARAISESTNPWDPIEIKRKTWKAENDLADTIAEADRLFGDCEASFESALSHVRNLQAAQEGLAELYWLRFLEAESRRDPRWMRRWEELIRRYDSGHFQARLEGKGSLCVDATVPNAEVLCRAMKDEEGRSVLKEAVSLGTSPTQKSPCAMGSYRIEVKAPGCAALVLPIQIRRLEDLAVSCQPVSAERLLPGFVHVPAGPVTLGGDRGALDPRPPTLQPLSDFALARFPVTVSEYLDFLIDLQRIDPKEATHHGPRARTSAGSPHRPLFILPQDGDISFPFQDSDGRHWEADWPIVSVTAASAEAYARWRSASDGMPTFRLPRDSEWEKAARGADQRLFPWGDRFDATYCLMAESRPGGAKLSRVGEIESDESPYGIRDLGGGVRDWVAWDDPANAPAGKKLLRGGSYGTVSIYSRCASRSEVPEDYVGSHVGFRLAYDLS